MSHISLQELPASSLDARSTNRRFFAKVTTDDLARKSIRGGAVSLVSQGVRFGLRTVSMMMLARLLTPEDFGLQGMVGAFTGFLGLFRDAGLSTVTVQRDEITHEQTSTLFWVNAG